MASAVIVARDDPGVSVASIGFASAEAEVPVTSSASCIFCDCSNSSGVIHWSKPLQSRSVQEREKRLLYNRVCVFENRSFAFPKVPCWSRAYCINVNHHAGNKRIW